MEGAGGAILVEDPSDVLDNVESQGSTRNLAIIMAARQKASWNSILRKLGARGLCSIRAICNLARYHIVIIGYRLSAKANFD